MQVAGVRWRVIRCAGLPHSAEAGRPQVRRNEQAIERRDLDRRGLVDPAQPPLQLVRRSGCKIALRQQQPVRDGGLLDGLGMAVERIVAEQRVDGRRDRAQLELPREYGIGEEGLHDRLRIGEPRGLHDDAIERRDLATPRFAEHGRERVDEIAAHGAAQAAAAQQHDVAGRALDEVVIEPDVAQLVDDDECTRHAGIAHQPVEQRRLPTAEKAGEDRDGDFGGRGGHGAGLAIT